MHSHGTTCQNKLTLNTSYFKVTLIVDKHVGKVYCFKLHVIFFPILTNYHPENLFKFLFKGTSEKPPMVDHTYKTIIRFHKEP